MADLPWRFVLPQATDNDWHHYRWAHVSQRRCTCVCVRERKTGKQRTWANMKSDLGAWGDDGDDGDGGGWKGSDPYTVVSEEITARIYRLSSNVNMLKRMVQSLGTSSDTQALRKQMFENERESNTISRDVMTKLRRLNELQNEGDAQTQHQRKTQTDKLSRDFKAVLLRVDATNKAFKNKAKQAKVQVPDAFPGADDDGVDDETSLLELRATEQHEVQAQEYVDNERLIRDREEGIQDIEKSVIEVNEIFKDLNSLVVAQGEMVDTIEANIVTAADRVEVGTEDLVRARSSQKKATRKTIFIAAVALLALIVLILIIYFSTRKKI